jgi:CDP-paratose 2-epimerase
MSRQILITGGAGFVGSSLGIGFANLYPDWEILALDNLKRRGSELSLPRLNQAGVKFIHGDIRNPEDLELSGFDPDLILECSAEASVLAGYTSPGYTLNTNLVGTINCLELARRTKADFIFLSTSRVYPISYLSQAQYTESDTRFELNEHQTIEGLSKYGVAENFPLDKARSIYGTTKLASELLIMEYAESYGLRTIINRCGVLTGPWQMGKTDQGVFALWMARHYFSKSLQYIGYGGTGRQVRDFLHVADLIDLIDLQIQQFDRIEGQIFNVGGGESHSLSLLETTKICQEITGNTVSIESMSENRKGDVPIFLTDSRKVIEVTGWSPTRNSTTTLKDIYEWIHNNQSQLKYIVG